MNNYNSAMTQSPLMVDAGKLNQDEMKNVLSSTANNDTNITNNIMGKYIVTIWYEMTIYYIMIIEKYATSYY